MPAMFRKWGRRAQMLRRHCRKLGAVCRLWSMTRAPPWPFGGAWAWAEENEVKKNARPKEFVLWAGIRGVARGRCASASRVSWGIGAAYLRGDLLTAPNAFPGLGEKLSLYLFDLLGNDFEVVAEDLNAALDVGNEGVAGLGFRVEEGEIRLVSLDFGLLGFVGTLETL